MNKRDSTDHFLDGALLEPLRHGGPIRLRRYLPGAALADIVRHFWFVSWELPPGQSFVQPVLPLPAVNAVVEPDGAWVYGAWSRRYDKVLTESGHAFGILFLPTGFAPFARGSMHLLTDRRERFDAVFQPASRAVETASSSLTAAEQLAARLQAQPSDEEAVNALEGYLLGCQRSEPPAPEVRDWVASVERDPTLLRVEQLADLHGVTVRTLQRTLRRVVGLGPKQLIRRYRLLEAASRLVAGSASDQVQLALELGYADQAHFARDFRAVTGTTPGRQGKRRSQSVSTHGVGAAREG